VRCCRHSYLRGAPDTPGEEREKGEPGAGAGSGASPVGGAIAPPAAASRETEGGREREGRVVFFLGEVGEHGPIYVDVF